MTASTSKKSFGGPKPVPKSWTRRKVIRPCASKRSGVAKHLWRSPSAVLSAASAAARRARTCALHCATCCGVPTSTQSARSWLRFACSVSATARRSLTICWNRLQSGIRYPPLHSFQFTSLDHLVGEGEQLVGNLEAERPRGLQIDHQLIFRWRLHRQIGRPLALEDAIHIAGRTPALVDEIRSVGNQAARVGEATFVVDCGQLVPGCERDDQVAMKRC